MNIVDKFKEIQESQIWTFLAESNKIEGVYDRESVKQARKAWDYLIECDKLTISNILKTHKILMEGKLKPAVLGRFRRQSVWIGNKPGKPWWEIPNLMAEWINRVNRIIEDDCNQPSEDSMISHHIKFENIHPFIDGNGRIGRILFNWERLKNGYEIEIINEADKLAYYGWFS